MRGIDSGDGERGIVKPLDICSATLPEVGTANPDIAATAWQRKQFCASDDASGERAATSPENWLVNTTDDVLRTCSQQCPNAACTHGSNVENKNRATTDTPKHLCRNKEIDFRENVITEMVAEYQKPPASNSGRL